MRDTRSYKEIFKQQDIVRILCHIATVGIIIFLIVRFIMALIPSIGDPNNRLVSYLAVSGLYLLPYAFELITKKRITNFILAFYIIYVLIAGVLCSCLNFYSYWLGFDKVVHGAFGYVGSMIGLLLICQLGNYESQSPIFIVLVCFGISMGLGACWEIIEFTGDTFFNQTAQGALHEIVDGENIIYVRDLMDTMLDLVTNFGGAIVFAIHYIIHRATGKNLLMGFMVNDFLPKKIQPADDQPQTAEIGAEQE